MSRSELPFTVISIKRPVVIHPLCQSILACPRLTTGFALRLVRQRSRGESIFSSSFLFPPFASSYSCDFLSRLGSWYSSCLTLTLWVATEPRRGLARPGFLPGMKCSQVPHRETLEFPTRRLILLSKQAKAMCITFACSERSAARCSFPRQPFGGTLMPGISGIGKQDVGLTKTQSTKAAKQKH